jgi:uncharacterized protein
MNIAEEVRKFVEEECKKETSKYGYEPYACHFIPMHDYAKKLAEGKKADVEVVELAAWLHDLGSIIYGRENHHISGAEIAEKKLKELKYPEEKIELIKKCIMNHRGSFNLKKENVEEQIIADADAMSCFDNVSGIFKAAFVYEKQHQKQAQETTRQKLDNAWKKLSLPESKALIKPRYEAAMVLLK